MPHLKQPFLQDLWTEALKAFHSQQLTQSEVMCYTILRQFPQHAEAFYLLGVIYGRTNQHELALQFFRKAISQNPNIPEFHFELAHTLRIKGLIKESIYYFQQVVCLLPHSAEACLELGNALHASDELNQALQYYRQALQLKPDFTMANYNLGLALQRLNQHDEALEVFQQVLNHVSAQSDIYFQIANIYSQKGMWKEAVEHYQQAIQFNSENPDFFHNLAVAYFFLEKLEKAKEFYRQALYLQPNLKLAIQGLGKVFALQSNWEKAFQYFTQYTQLNYGKPWTRETKLVVSPSIHQARLIINGRYKLSHDMEQYEYLLAIQCIPSHLKAYLKEITSLYRSILQENSHTEHIQLAPHILHKIDMAFEKCIYRDPAPALKKSTINPALDFEAIQANYHEGQPMTYFDQGLTTEALEALRQFCLKSTIWHDYTRSKNYIATYDRNGFYCELLFQIADELIQRFPTILGSLKLIKMWAFMNNHQSEGVGIHSDCAAVNVVFWITPDEANLDPDSGGVRVWDIEPSEELSDAEVHQFQRKNDLEAYIKNNAPQEFKITYRQNRIVIFRPTLYHRTDKVLFKKGYENRRINVVMAFGRREWLPPE